MYLSNPYFFNKWFQINNNSLPWLQYYTITDAVDNENHIKFKMAYNDSHSEFLSRNDHAFSFKFLMNQIPLITKLVLLGSSNGLVLCLSRNSDEQCRYHVCNPLTQTWVSLPLPPPFVIEGGLDVAGIFCDYSSSFTSCYKVIRIPEFDEPSNKVYVDMFSSDLGVWESFEVSCDENVVWEFSSLDKVVIHNGVLFWIEGRDRMLVYNTNQQNKSDGHRCSLINLPDDEEFDDAEYSNFSHRIWESDSLLCYAKTKRKGTGMTLIVWVLNDVSRKVLQKGISLDDILAEVRSRIAKVVVLQVWLR